MTDTLDSYVCGTANAPLLGDTIGRCLDQAARRWSDREALVSPSHDVRWIRRTKKNSLPPHASQEDRMRFSKARSYLVRVDDMANCKNPRCRKRFEITSLQTVAFL